MIGEGDPSIHVLVSDEHKFPGHLSLEQRVRLKTSGMIYPTHINFTVLTPFGRHQMRETFDKTLLKFCSLTSFYS